MAEVLITLGIIGVVAAMTLPNLVAKYRGQAVVTKLKKMYSVMSQVMLMSVPDGDYNNIPIIDGGINGVNNFFNEYLKPQLKILRVCHIDSKECWAETRDKSNKKVSVGSGTLPFITTDGYAFTIDTWNAQDYETVSKRYGINFSGNSPMLVIYADANGFQKPNVLGKDVFVYVFSERGLLPAGRDKTDTEIESECKSTGYFCFEKYIRNNWEIPAEDVW